MEKIHNYVYCITYVDQKKYIGVRSCNCNIENDNYMGSAFHIPEEIKSTGRKEILSIHTTRKEAMEEEIRLHALYDVKNNHEYYNQCNSNSIKFQCSSESNKRSAETRRGRTAETHLYIAKQVESRRKYKGIENRTEAQRKADTDSIKIQKANIKRRQYVGENRTIAQIEASKIQAEKIRGVKNPRKGFPHQGIKCKFFIPWYSINPDGEKIEYYLMTKTEFRNKMNITRRMFDYRFSKEQEHKKITAKSMRKSPIYNWTFGNIT